MPSPFAFDEHRRVVRQGGNVQIQGFRSTGRVDPAQGASGGSRPFIFAGTFGKPFEGFSGPQARQQGFRRLLDLIVVLVQGGEEMCLACRKSGVLSLSLTRL